MADSFVRNILQQWKLDKYIPAFEDRFSRLHRESTGFGESVRDWLKNIKSQIFGKGKSKETSEDFNKLIQDILKNNQSRDCGFRIGNRYYIHMDPSCIFIKPDSAKWNYGDASEAKSKGFSDENGGEGADEENSTRAAEPDEILILTESPDNKGGKTDGDNNVQSSEFAEVIAPTTKKKFEIN